jgi:hypothetical protein
MSFDITSTNDASVYVEKMTMVIDGNDETDATITTTAKVEPSFEFTSYFEGDPTTTWNGIATVVNNDTYKSTEKVTYVEISGVGNDFDGKIVYVKQ